MNSSSDEQKIATEDQGLKMFAHGLIDEFITTILKICNDPLLLFFKTYFKVDRYCTSSDLPQFQDPLVNECFAEPDAVKKVQEAKDRYKRIGTRSY
jgi:hypothetical protein